MDKKLIKRDILDEIARFLDTDNIIVLHGPRQVGKTHIMYLLQNLLIKKGRQTHFVDLEDLKNVDTLDMGVESFLDLLSKAGFNLRKIENEDGRLFVFIDEIQYLKNPSSFLKLIVDHHKYLQLIVSGSSSFDIKRKFTDSLVGRTVNFEILNLSFREFLRFKNIKFNAADVTKGPFLSETVRLYGEYMSYSGYPKIVLADGVKDKEKLLSQIVDTYVRKDIRDLAEIREIGKFNDLLTLLASQSGQLLNVNELSNTLKSDHRTIERYLSILENTYIIKLIYSFSNSARVGVVKSPKIFFYDTGLLQMLTRGHLSQEPYGHLFETSVFAELAKKYGMREIHFWRTPTQTEVDFVITKRGEVKPFEVKINFNSFNRKAILSFCEKYKVKDYKVVGLKGEPRDEHFIYPWEI